MLTKFATSLAVVASMANADKFLDTLGQQEAIEVQGEEMKTLIWETWEGDIKETLLADSEWNDEMSRKLMTPNTLIHYGFTDIMNIVTQLSKELPDFVKVSSIGESYQGRAIPLVTLMTGDKPLSERPSVLSTGAHHAREAISIQMNFYSIFRVLHGALHNDPHYINMLTNNALHFVPAVNIDGVNYIEEAYLETGEFPIERKNRNNTWGKCPEAVEREGVDINRNYGFAHGQHGKKNNPCIDDFAGPKPFSEPETRAMRDFVLRNVDNLKFVYNHHAYGNMYLSPFNAVNDNFLAEAFPVQSTLFDDIMRDGHPAPGIRYGTAPSVLGYASPGEASDWCMAATGIPAISPEVGLSNRPDTEWFRLEDAGVVNEVLEQWYPIIEHTFDLLEPQVKITEVNKTFYGTSPDSQFHFEIEFGIENKGLSAMKESTVLEISSSDNVEFSRVYKGTGFGDIMGSDNLGAAIQYSPVLARDTVSYKLQGKYTDPSKKDFSVTFQRVGGDFAVPETTTLDVHEEASVYQWLSQTALGEEGKVDYAIYFAAACSLGVALAAMHKCRSYKKSKGEQADTNKYSQLGNASVADKTPLTA